MLFEFNRGYLCSNCRRRFVKADVAYTYKTSCICNDCCKNLKPFPKNSCLEGKGEIEFVSPGFEYESVYRNMFLRFKFNGDLACGHLLGKAVGDCFEKYDIFDEYSYIVPVPISKERLMERGFNQTEIMAEYVSKALNIPILKALVRIKHTMPQSRATGRDRVGNTDGAFKAKDSFNGEKVIVFDDVYTSGSTANACAKELLRAGAAGVCAIASARVYKERGFRDYLY